MWSLRVFILSSFCARHTTCVNTPWNKPGSASYDLRTKLRVYRRSGLEESTAVQMYEQRIDWFHRFL
jgi:hypothetical protein